MPVDWTEHRFAGGALALDVANTVVLRTRPAQTFDRFNSAAELPRFAQAATGFRRAEISGQEIVADPAERMQMIELRETIDALFRGGVQTGVLDTRELSGFLAASAKALRSAGGQAALDRDSHVPLPLPAATALSGLALLAPQQWRRTRICDNCGWLFLDRSKNRSRRWCDMAVCGNRNKARRHYERSKEQP